jgi:hypothetical protein
MKNKLSLPIYLFALLFSLETGSFADTVCLKAQVKAGKVSLSKKVVKTNRCPKGFLSIVDTSSLVGPQGAPGPTGLAGLQGLSGPTGSVGPTGSAGLQGASGPTGAAGAAGAEGADGSLRIYGDGSAGALNVTSSITLPGTNHQYTNISIASGVTLTVPSGTVLRCSGTFTNSGTLAVSSSGGFGTIEVSSTAATGAPTLRVPGYGVALGPAGAGEFGSNTINLFGGGPASGLSAGQASAIRYPPPASCGSGAGGGFFGATGGSSGGAVVVLCRNNILINPSGIITANGLNGSGGSGGGAGGIVILASKTNITNSGTISVNGGNGGSSTQEGAAGGGGGGGIIHLIAPTVFSAGSLNRSGGGTGLTTVPPANSPRFGGGAGGSCGGSGGFGFSVSTSNVQNLGQNGQLGHALTTSADPTSLF